MLGGRPITTGVPGLPCLVSVAIYAVLLLLTLTASVARNEGHLTYAVDDTYIHMAMAKNLALHGVWGVTRYEYTASSSGPLWTLLVAVVYRICGVSEAAPLALNAILGLGVLLAADRLARRLGAPAWRRLLVGVGIVYLGPLVFLVCIGMEHLLHSLLAILFVTYVFDRLTSEPARCPEQPGGTRRVITAALLGLGLMATRYESVVIIGIACFILAVLRHYVEAVGTILGAFVPVVAMGIANKLHGWMFLPASVALKGFGMKAPITHGVGGLWHALVSHTAALSHFTVLIVAAILLALVLAIRPPDDADRNGSNPRAIVSGWFALAAIVHLSAMFGGNEAMDLRYSGYLAILGCSIVGGLDWRDAGLRVAKCLTAYCHLPPRTVVPVAAIAGVCFVPLAAMQVVPVLHETPTRTVFCMDNIYRQQYQTARLVRHLPAGTTVSLVDIGAVCFYADIRCVDLVGLATREVAEQRLRRRGQGQGSLVPLYRDLIRRRAPRLIVAPASALDAAGPALPRLWEPHVPSVLPQELVPLGIWFTPRNIVCADAAVIFLARDASDAELRRTFQQVTTSLPRDMVTRVFE